jgi:hypothetical protein
MSVKNRNYKIYLRDKTDSSTLDTLDTTNLMCGSVINELNSEQSLTFTVDRRDAAWDHLDLGNIVYLMKTTEIRINTYRLMKRKQFMQGRKLFAEIYCEHLKYDLNHRIVNTYKKWIQVTPITILTELLTYSDSFTVGGVTPSDEIDFEVDYETCYEAISRLAELTGYDWEVIADGGANHKKVYIRTINNTTNGTPGTAEIEYGVNLKSLSFEESLIDGFASRIVARGGASVPGQRTMSTYIRDNVNAIAMDVVGAQFTVENYDNGTGWITIHSDKLLAVDGCLNGYYAYILSWETGPDLAVTAILDSVKQAGGYDKIQVNPAAFGGEAWQKPNPGDAVYIYSTSTVPAKSIIDLVAENAYYRIERVFKNEDLPDILNAAGSFGKSDLSGSYTSGLNDYLFKIDDPTCSENTTLTYIKYGTKSQKVIANTGQGVKRYIETFDNVAISFYVWIYISSIANKVTVRISTNNDGDYFPTNSETGANEAFVTTTGWHQIIVEGGVKEAGTTTWLEVFAEGGSATFYLDAMFAVLSEYIIEENTFYPNCSRSVLWENGVNELKESNAPKETYDVNILDLYEHDSITYASLKFLPGDDVQIIASVFDIDSTVRVKRKKWDLLKPWLCEVDIE